MSVAMPCVVIKIESTDPDCFLTRNVHAQRKIFPPSEPVIVVSYLNKDHSVDYWDLQTQLHSVGACPTEAADDLNGIIATLPRVIGSRDLLANNNVPLFIGSNRKIRVAVRGYPDVMQELKLPAFKLNYRLVTKHDGVEQDVLRGSIGSEQLLQSLIAHVRENYDLFNGTVSEMRNIVSHMEHQFPREISYCFYDATAEHCFKVGKFDFQLTLELIEMEAS